mmetsp:Transcript_26816/g.33078  ORF Transcript_26816/g.33078 Transcript_26816/m.33078 type:complete len:175 (-) Transcript_26816:723-1247(-)
MVTISRSWFGVALRDFLMGDDDDDGVVVVVVVGDEVVTCTALQSERRIINIPLVLDVALVLVLVLVLVLLLECRNDVCVSSIPLFVCIICGFSTAATWFVSTTCELALPEHRPMYGPSMAKQAAAAAMGNLCFRGEVDLYIFRIDNEVGVGVDDGVDVGVDVDSITLICSSTRG